MRDEPHDSWASVYDEAYQKSFGGIYSSLTDLTLDFVQTNTKSGASILDVGAGTGRLSIPLSEFGFTVVAVDASSQMLRVLAQKDLKNRIQTIHSKVQDMDLGHSYDVVMCVFSVFCYLTEPEDLHAAIEQIAKHASSGGYVLIDVPGYYSFRSLKFRSKSLDRTVEVNEINADRNIFEYAEKVVIKLKGKRDIFEDRFIIRYWEPDLILSKFEDCGMTVNVDLSYMFAGSGAQYFLLTKD